MLVAALSSLPGPSPHGPRLEPVIETLENCYSELWTRRSRNGRPQVASISRKDLKETMIIPSAKAAMSVAVAGRDEVEARVRISAPDVNIGLMIRREAITMGWPSLGTPKVLNERRAVAAAWVPAKRRDRARNELARQPPTSASGSEIW